MNTATHELGHNILRDETHICSLGLYGLMTAGKTLTVPFNEGEVPARRSYFHGRNIMRLRSGSLAFNYYPVP